MNEIRLKYSALMMCLTLVAGAARAASPRVTSAAPDNGDVAVDPGTKQIVVTFDQPMNREGHSIVGSGPEFPAMQGWPRWTDDRTVVISVQLEPNRTYRLSINSGRFTNFRSQQGEPAVPYPIVFRTAQAAVAVAGAAAATAPVRTALAPDVNRTAIDRLRKAVDDNYSYRDLRKVDWPKQFADFSPRLEAARTSAEFARVAATMLEPAMDAHLSLKAGIGSFPTHSAQAEGNLNFALLSKTVTNWFDQDGTTYTGRFDDNVGYVLVTTWAADRRAAIEKAYQVLNDPQPRALIVDVRMNSGGDETLARDFAGCFVAERKVYAKNTIRKDGQWLGPFDRVVEPNKDRPAYRGKVIVLQGSQCMSSNESFLLMMKAAGATLVGMKSYGSSGNPNPFELGNGVTVFLPSWQDMRLDGTCFENEGIAPDIEVKTAPADFKNADPVLEAALRIAREQR